MIRVWIAVRMTIALTLLTGIVYPVAMVALAHLCFPRQADGSLIFHDGRVVGSSLIGQKFSSPRYFHGRPSAAGSKGYDAASSGGSNLAPTNQALIDSVRSRVRVLRETEPGLNHGEIPVGMVTSSASGLDPDISPASAYAQAARIAAARGLSEDQVRALIAKHTEERLLRIFGARRVNVLQLNLALDSLAAADSSNRHLTKEMAHR